MKFFLVLSFVNLIVISVFADSGLVQVPDQCLDKELAPCLVRSKDDTFKVTPSRLKFYLGQNSLLKVSQFPGSKVTDQVSQFRIELLKGKVVIDNNVQVPFYLNTVNVGLKEIYYIKKSDSQNVIELYKAKEAIFFNITKNQDMDLVETRDFASRLSTTEFIEQFKNIPTAVKKDTLAQYDLRLIDEAQNQKRVLQRKIAMQEDAQKNDAEARQKQKIESKRIKAMFFMRTFEK